MSNRQTGQQHGCDLSLNVTKNHKMNIKLYNNIWSVHKLISNMFPEVIIQVRSRVIFS